ncbi:hypothetical protein L195_g047313 [Trifolium pratense]|uniref:Uncharacterized protein n=1 Tax=Trifolium pratense TaxID=57577 RepID=A0A2K3MK15_TRIPR|nr:hypothetical protein L195_g047313 [Trifolium pratense]
MASKKSKTKPPEKDRYLASYPRTLKISPHAGPEERKEHRKKVHKPIENVLWKQIQKLRKEQAALDKARIILKKKKRRAQKKFRKKQLLNN